MSNRWKLAIAIIVVVIVSAFVVNADAKVPEKHKPKPVAAKKHVKKVKSGPTLAQRVKALTLTVQALSLRLEQVSNLASQANVTAENGAAIATCITTGKWLAVNADNFFVGSDGTEPTAFVVATLAPGCVKK